MYIIGGYNISPEKFGNLESTVSKKKIPSIKPSLLGWSRLDRAFRPAQLACIAIGEALKQAEISWPLNENSDRTAMIILTKDSNLSAIEMMYLEIKKFGFGKSNPGVFPWTVLNVIGGFASIYFNIHGLNITLSHNGNNGLDSILYAEDLISSGNYDRVIVCELELFPEHMPELHPTIESNYENVTAVIFEKESGNGSAKTKFSSDSYSSRSEKSILTQIVDNFFRRKDLGVQHG
ncbi:hypothetical protein [Cytobacillus oceanisediminis]|uniref:hypothetical protein n=1 Tax=Cytobacillus oceanisediminis TaxID=665099 RepID=UPI001C2147B3|nr:hypothetical protein [Cytobacillus oceanisediminis]MBU8772037.1 hypothetical protein [Cytobacillus oceanisediminis]